MYNMCVYIYIYIYAHMYTCFLFKAQAFDCCCRRLSATTRET